MPGAPFVELRDVEKRFGNNVVLEGINLSVAEHEVLCLIGVCLLGDFSRRAPSCDWGSPPRWLCVGSAGDGARFLP